MEVIKAAISELSFYGGLSFGFAVIFVIIDGTIKAIYDWLK